MAVINTGLTVAGLRSDFFQRLGSAAREWEELCTRVPSENPSENYRWLGSSPNMREWKGGRAAHGLRSEGYSIVNSEYESTIAVNRVEYEDDQTGQIRLRVQEMAARAQAHKTYCIEELLKYGGTTGYLSYDGVTYFNSAHVSGDSGEQSNDLAPPAVDADNPTTAEFKDAIKNAIAAMIAFKDDQGMPMRLGPSGLIAVVPPTMLFTALEALNATLISSTSNVLASAAKVMPLPGLTDGTTWYLCKTDGIVRPFIFQDRLPVEFAAVENPEDSKVFSSGEYLYGVRARYKIAYGLWQCCIRNVFTVGQ